MLANWLRLSLGVERRSSLCFRSWKSWANHRCWTLLGTVVWPAYQSTDTQTICKLNCREHTMG